MADDEFEAWMHRVDLAVQSASGVSVHDLPDYAFRDAFDGGSPPGEAAREVLEEAGWQG
jgi:hypothetical protein